MLDLGIVKRREIINGMGVGTGSAIATAACGQGSSPTSAQNEIRSPSPASPSIDWRMSTSWPQALDTILGSALAIGDRVSTLTGGRFTIKRYAAGEIVPALEVLGFSQYVNSNP